MEMIEFTARNRKERRGRPQHQSMLLLNPLARKELTCQESTRKAPTSERRHIREDYVDALFC